VTRRAIECDVRAAHRPADGRRIQNVVILIVLINDVIDDVISSDVQKINENEKSRRLKR